MVKKFEQVNQVLFNLFYYFCNIISFNFMNVTIFFILILVLYFFLFFSEIFLKFNFISIVLFIIKIF